MSSEKSTYDRYKAIVECYDSPCAVMSVQRTADGKCGEVRIFAANDKYSVTGEPTEGELYTKFLPHEPEFDYMCLQAAFCGERFHTYVDSRKLVGGWTENIVLPLKNDGEEDIGYCQFMYEVYPEMDPEKFSDISPSVAGVVIKSCLTLRKGIDFRENLKEVMETLREFTDALSACVVSVDKAKKKAGIIGQSIRGGAIAAEQLIPEVPYDVVESWKELIGESDCYIIRDKGDLDIAKETSPKWVSLLKADGVQSVCVVPLIHNQENIGYILLADYDVRKVSDIKETLEVLGLFLSSEMANNQFLKRLEWLTSIDMLTGVRNRSAMNRVVDELDARLKYQKHSFGVAMCAMNGLKALNAEIGHDAGNECLEKAGNILLEIFDESEIFRSAGEEFAIIAENISAEDFEEKINRLKEKGSDPEGVYFAIGYVNDKQTPELRKALASAHAMMQEEKDRFYEQYPDKKR